MVHSGKYLSKEKFVTGLEIAKNLDFRTLFLHGGEATVHSSVVQFAKDAGFNVNMFTNGIRMDVLREQDGL